MKRFELSERFFREIGFPTIEQRLPRCIPRLAVGVSEGSQAHKNDDEVSRDHDWGPGFTVWLAKDDFKDRESLIHMVSIYFDNKRRHSRSREKVC